MLLQVLHTRYQRPRAAVRSFYGKSVARIDQCCNAGVSLRASVGFFAKLSLSKKLQLAAGIWTAHTARQRNVTPKALVHD